MTHTTRLTAKFNEKGEYLYFVYGYKTEAAKTEPTISASNFLAGLGWFKRFMFILTF